MRIELKLNGYDKEALQRLLGANGGDYFGPLFEIPMITGGNRIWSPGYGLVLVCPLPDTFTFVIKTDVAWLHILDFLLAHRETHEH